MPKKKKRKKLSALLMVFLLPAVLLFGAAAATFYFTAHDDFIHYLIVRSGSLTEASIIDFESNGRPNPTFRLRFRYYDTDGARRYGFTTFAYTEEQVTAMWVPAGERTLFVRHSGLGVVQADFETSRQFWALLSACIAAVAAGIVCLVLFIIGLIKRGRIKEAGRVTKAKFLSYKRRRGKCSVRFVFKDGDDVPRIVKTRYKYTVDESEYLGELKEFEVKAYGGRAEITEKLEELEGWAEKKFGAAGRAYDEDSGKRVDWEITDAPDKEAFGSGSPITADFTEADIESMAREADTQEVQETQEAAQEEPPADGEDDGEYYGDEEYDEEFYEDIKEMMREMMVEMMSDMLQTDGEKMMKSMMKELQKDMSKSLKKSFAASMKKMLEENKKL